MIPDVRLTSKLFDPPLLLPPELLDEDELLLDELDELEELLLGVPLELDELLLGAPLELDELLPEVPLELDELLLEPVPGSTPSPEIEALIFRLGDSNETLVVPAAVIPYADPLNLPATVTPLLSVSKFN